MRWCHANNLAVVTHGGLTGLVHGGDAQPNDVILSLERMRAIEAIDPVQRTATVQAGVVLQTLQEEVDKHDLAFPLDLGARGSATIGGNAVDQRRRQPRDPLRHDPRHDARPRSGAGRRHRRLVAEPADQEQRRLRSQAAVHRLGRHARHHHAAGAAAAGKAAGDQDVAFAGVDSFRGADETAQAHGPLARRLAVGLRGDVAIVLPAGDDGAGQGAAAGRPATIPITC